MPRQGEVQGLEVFRRIREDQDAAYAETLRIDQEKVYSTYF